MKEYDVSAPAPVSRQVLNGAISKSNAIDKHDGGRLLSESIMQPAKKERFPDRRAQPQNDRVLRYLVRSEKNEKVSWLG